jgi:hypothetical protein
MLPFPDITSPAFADKINLGSNKSHLSPAKVCVVASAGLGIGAFA